MGVRGLTTFVNNNHNLLRKVNLQSEQLVIDGFGLAYYLYFEVGDLNSRFGLLLIDDDNF